MSSRYAKERCRITACNAPFRNILFNLELSQIFECLILSAGYHVSVQSLEDSPPGKDEKQTTIHGMGDPKPVGKVADFTVTAGQ